MKLITSDRRFWPLFWTQFFGALNDNILKNALVMMVTFRGMSVAGLDTAQIVALSGGLFILPFFLFSALAGQISDKWEKSRLVRLTKYWEVLIMIVAAVGFWLQNVEMLLAVLFLAGSQAAFFGPVKYSMIPDLVSPNELVEANAYVELGTFLAILIGTIAGGHIISLSSSEYWIAAVLPGLALVGVGTSLYVNQVPVAAADLKIRFNPLPTFSSMLGMLRESQPIYKSVLGISWFWFFGAAVLSILPVYCKDFLRVDEHVVTCFLAMFTVGIGVGSVLCEKLSFRRVELGLVPIGSLGLTIFLLDLCQARPAWDEGHVANFQEFIANGGPRMMADFFLMSLFGGFFILPLYTLIQERSHPEERSRVIAANNIINAVFMVIASLVVMAFSHFKFSFPQMFLALAVSNLMVSVYIYSVVPEFTLRFYAWILAHLIYRIRVEGEEHIPKKGAAILVCNHVSFVDWLLVAAMVRRPVRFIMYYKFWEIPLAGLLMRQAKVIPIAGSKENPEILERAFEQVSRELRDGELICIFPEGKLTRDGEMSEFRNGFERMLERDPVPVIPMAIKGLWRTFFTYGGGLMKGRMPRHWLKRVQIVIGRPVSTEEANARALEKRVRELLK